MQARIKRRSGSCGFDPPDSFPGDVIRYHGVPPDHPSHAVPPEGPVFHATMDGELRTARRPRTSPSSGSGSAS